MKFLNGESAARVALRFGATEVIGRRIRGLRISATAVTGGTTAVAAAESVARDLPARDFATGADEAAETLGAARVAVDGLAAGNLSTGTLAAGALAASDFSAGALPAGTLPTAVLAAATLGAGTLPAGTVTAASLPPGARVVVPLPAAVLAGGAFAVGVAAVGAPLVGAFAIGVCTAPVARVPDLLTWVATADLPEGCFGVTPEAADLPPLGWLRTAAGDVLPAASFATGLRAGATFAALCFVAGTLGSATLGFADLVAEVGFGDRALDFTTVLAVAFVPDLADALAVDPRLFPADAAIAGLWLLKLEVPQ